MARSTALIGVVAGLATGTAAWPPLVPAAGAAPLPGVWTQLTAGMPVPLGNTPSVLELPNGRAYVIWDSKAPGGKLQTYYFATLTPYGTLVSPAASVFGGGYWQALNPQATLVADGSAPLLIFQGSRSLKKGDAYGAGCTVGALGPIVPWGLQAWSLTNPCGVVEPGGATELKGGALSAEEPAGTKLAYLLHQEPGVPPSTKLPHDALSPAPTAIGHSAEVTDLAGSGDAYASWDGIFAKGADGVFVKNLSANGPAMKAPGSGERSAEAFPPVWSIPAVASTNTHAGVYLAYCSNTPACSVLLWRVGAPSAAPTPATGLRENIAPVLAPGPGGRLWLAWYYTDKSGTISVSVTRTNEADTAFGPVTSYPTGCWGYPPLIGLGGGSWGRLDVAMQCTVNHPRIALEEFVTQTLVPLSVSPEVQTFEDIKPQLANFTVTDVDDPVPGATVSIPAKGLSATTGAAGTATLTLPMDMPPGHYTVIVSAPNYRPVDAQVVVTSPKVQSLLWR